MKDNPKVNQLKAEIVKNILSLPDYDEKGYPNILKKEFVKRLKAKRKTLSLKLDD